MTHVHGETYSQESEQLALGETRVILREQRLDREGREYCHREVLVGDESDDNPELRDLYAQQGNYFEAMLRVSPDVAGTMVEEGLLTVPEGNAAAQWLYFGEEGGPTQMQEWATRFPTAIALEPLQRLSAGGAWLGDGALDARTLEFFTHMVDGIGLRSRARIYEQLLVDLAEKRQADSLEVVSLGSGAAVPNVQATRRLEAAGRAVHWRFYDRDPEALRFAEALIAEHDFSYSTFHYGPTVTNPQTGRPEPLGQSYSRAFRLENESVDVVDALGLWEYLKPEHAVRFLKELYAKLKPDGSLIVSNMTPDRPQREFNQRAVGWPGLYLRDETALLDIVEAAGIATNLVTVTHAQDGVYLVMEVVKPEC